MTPQDAAIVDRWWSTFVATGRLPAELELVQGRLVRAVHRGDLPSGRVYLKAMTFPRTKDRVRYALRALPAAHEAAMLAATAAAGVPCPEVVDVRMLRRAGVPFRSLLVLRELPVDDAGPPTLGEQAALASRLLAAGIVHGDLHGGNFVRLREGGAAVLDMQSARRRRVTRAHHVACAARLLQDRPALDDESATALMIAAGLLGDEAEGSSARARAAHGRLAFTRGRVLRCFAESTEFTRRFVPTGREHRTRGELPPGRWCRHPDAKRAWIGQRALFVLDGRPPVFAGFRRNWWWLGGGGSLYVPAPCGDDRLEAEVHAAAAGYSRFRALDAAPARERGGH